MSSEESLDSISIDASTTPVQSNCGGEGDNSSISSNSDGCDCESYYSTGSTVYLHPGTTGSHDGDAKYLLWLKIKCRQIFRRKTLLMRVPVLRWLPNYSKNDFLPDLIAGVTVGVAVIPQALAYATIAGLDTQYGLYSAYVGCFAYLFFGSTRVVTIGPSSILALITHGPVTLMGPGAATLLAFFTGCISLLMGFLNFGFLIEFIGAPVIAGFTTAASFTTMTSQVKSLLGLKFEADGFIDTWKAVFEHINETRPWDAVMGFSSIAALLILRVLGGIKLGKTGQRTTFQRIFNRTMWLVSTSRNAVIFVICSVIAYYLTDLNIPMEDNPFILVGNITPGMPPFQAPPFFIEFNDQTFNFAEICQNLGSAIIVVPIIAILESVSVAKSFAKGDKVDSSQEMIAIGASNLIGSFVSSFPVTGSISRTAINNSCGVRTPFGGLYTGVLIILAITVLTPYFYFIPKTCLAAVIICAVLFMVEAALMKLVWKSRKLDLIPLLVTFLCCLFLSLELGILIGTAVNLAMLLYSTARPRIKILKFKGLSSEYLLVTPDRSLVFAAMDCFMSAVRKATALHPGAPVVIDLSYVSIADFTTAYGFNHLTGDLHKQGIAVILTKTQPRVLSVLLGVKPKLHVHSEGTDLRILLKEIASGTVNVEKKDVLQIEAGLP